MNHQQRPVMGLNQKEGVMPKETVYGNSPPCSPTEEGGPGRSVVQVSWNRDAGHVQVVSKAIAALSGGRLCADDEGIHYTDGFYVDLDRAGINALIRNLRRARDNALGKDA